MDTSFNSDISLLFLFLLLLSLHQWSYIFFFLFIYLFIFFIIIIVVVLVIIYFLYFYLFIFFLLIKSFSKLFSRIYISIVDIYIFFFSLEDLMKKETDTSYVTLTSFFCFYFYYYCCCISDHTLPSLFFISIINCKSYRRVVIWNNSMTK